MLEEYGNFWDIEADARCITTNAILRKSGKAVMGKGVALEARKRYNAQDYDLESILGKLIHEKGNHVFYLGHNLFSFPTKWDWRDKSDMSLIERSCHEIMFLMKDFPDYHKVLMTEPGCGNGGLHWKDVKHIIQNILDDRFVVVHNMGGIAKDMKCSCGGVFTPYMRTEGVPQRGTKNTYQCNKCSKVFER